MFKRFKESPRVSQIIFFTSAIITFPICFVIASVIWILTVWWDRKLRILQQFTCLWGSLYTWLIPMWKISIDGKEHYNWKATYVIVSNHQSQLDILVNFRLFFHYKIVSKTEIFKVPCIGWNMSLNRYIKLVRGDKHSISNMMKKCEETIGEGSSVFLYPEGTRSVDGQIHKFKLGAFELAKKMKVPILPIIINGTRDALPKHTMKTSGIHKIHQRVLPPVPYSEFADLSAHETSDMVREIMIAALDKLRKEKA